MATSGEAGSFRDASFHGADFSGAVLRDCNLRGLKVTDSWLADVNISGLISRFVVNDVDVTDYVSAELDRRHPERVQLRQVRTPDDYRAMWDTVERMWADTVARARRLGEPALHERVDGEWSFTETMRHLVFATDAWASRTILDEPSPYHRLALTHTPYPREDALALGMELDADPGFDEVMEARADRLAVVRRIVDGLDEGELARVCTRLPAPGYPEVTHTVGECLRTVITEECGHHHYATRDLAVLEARA
jgi:hypothetical protein